MYKVIKISVLVGVIFVIGGFGVLFFERIVIPVLATHKVISQLSFFQNVTERTTVVNKTEEIIIKENDSLRRVSTQVRQSIVMVAVKFSDSMTYERAGVVITDDGVIAIHRSDATSDAMTYGVLFSDGIHRSAHFLTNDTLTDITLLQLDDVDGVQALPFIHDDDLFTGQRIVAFAIDDYAKDLFTIAPAYIQRISSVSSIDMIKGYGSSEKWQGIIDVVTDLQNDDAILVTHRGELAGLIYRDDKMQQKSIPIAAIRYTLDHFVARNDKENDPELGITYRILTPLYALEHDMKMQGVIVQKIDTHQRASMSTLRAGDQIISIDSIDITQESPMSILLRKYRRGDSISLTVIRNGVEQEISIKL